MPTGGIRTRDLSSRAAADPRLRPRGRPLGPAMYERYIPKGVHLYSFFKNAASPVRLSLLGLMILTMCGDNDGT